MAPAPVFPQALAMLIAFWVNGLLHGMYLILFTRWVFMRRNGGGKTSLYYNITNWAVFALSNVDTAINFGLMIVGFWTSLTNGSGGPVPFFNSFSNWETIWRECNYQIIVALADLMMVHRLWVIWGRNHYLGGFALLLWAVELVFGFLAPARLAMQQFELLPFAINAQLGFNTTLQIALTALIAIRIMRPKYDSMDSSQKQRRRQLVQCFIESGALVTLGVVIDLALFAQNILFHWVFNISLAQLYAISTVMIVLRLNGMYNSNSQIASTGPGRSVQIPLPVSAAGAGNVSAWREPKEAFQPQKTHYGKARITSGDNAVIEGIVVHVTREQSISHHPYIPRADESYVDLSVESV